ncbi:MAG: LytTR family transcriptional regulator [Maribacter sp.]|nr:LytTR family transcriptional regulator [Maribacter sp.]
MTSISISQGKSHKGLNGKWGLFFLFLMFFYALNILQDLLSAVLRNTGFYWSETLLYNSYWLWFLPLLFMVDLLLPRMRSRSFLQKFSIHLLVGVLFSALHILIFTGFFTLMSHLLFENPHRFMGILKSALSNQSYITLMTYAFVPWVFGGIVHFKKPLKDPVKDNYIDLLFVKSGVHNFRIPVDTIQCIYSNRPYTEIRTHKRGFLHNYSLVRFENSLDPKTFIRVHKSVIVNKKYIRQLKSRGNGDYDAELTNGEMVRFSRHLRNNWECLLNQ